MVKYAYKCTITNAFPHALTIYVYDADDVLYFFKILSQYLLLCLCAIMCSGPHDDSILLACSLESIFPATFLEYDTNGRKSLLT